MTGIGAVCEMCGCMVSSWVVALCDRCVPKAVANEKRDLLKKAMELFHKRVLVDWGNGPKAAFIKVIYEHRMAGFVDQATHTKVCAFDNRLEWCVEQMVKSLDTKEV